MSTHHELDTLRATLNRALDDLRAELDAMQLPPLSTTSKERHPLDDPNYLPSRKLYHSRGLALGGYSVHKSSQKAHNVRWDLFQACMGQLKSLIQNPFDHAVEQSYAVFETAAIESFVQTGIVDVLAGSPDGVHVTDVQQHLDLSSTRCLTILRYLTTHGWVRECKEGTFALNRPALALLEGNSARSWIAFSHKPQIAMALVPWLQHKEWRHSSSHVETAFQISHSTELSYFDWMKQNPEYMRMFSIGMQSLGASHTQGIVADFPWHELETPTVVDIGGGNGSLAATVSKHYPHLRFIVQDRPPVVDQANKHLLSVAKDAYEAGRITAEPYDFFLPQPHTGDEYSFMFRHVLHDWPHDKAVSILRTVARAAGQKSKILIIERISALGRYPSYSCLPEAPKSPLITNGYKQERYTPFIPENLGAASRVTHAITLYLMSILNAHERTVTEWTALIEEAGLRVVKVHALRSPLSLIECAVMA
ncbi:S-adenosyl-L-methionine-dependent methyltransferase [Cristinia sonorae]|uniref:S-adenosyl-L-methionine-dependent methyltransferase n=1 Tax=Cristinia sonorae TaxID=1940300 RepID=A0A8K0UNB5_9AGAR|nr:S-adenosyl-L-methionine-dependent methyltransferase [Cristinia sonorae]